MEITKEDIFDAGTKDLYDKFLEYFSLEEVFREPVINKYKPRIGTYGLLSRIDKRLIETILFIRINLDRSITVNNYKWGGRFDERGLRDNKCPMVRGKAGVYLSGHVLSMALDFDVDEMTATEVRRWLVENADNLPHPIRLERDYGGREISWVHLDVCEDPRNPKVYLFDV